MKITLVTSMKFKEKALEVTSELEKMGHKVRVPVDSLKELTAKVSFNDDTLLRIHEHFIRSWIFWAVPWADLILIINSDGKYPTQYFGINVAMELGTALYLQKPIITLYDHQDQEELKALKVPSLNGDLSKISEYES